MIKDVNGRFDNYSISPKIRQVLLRWGYELVQNDFLRFIFFLLQQFYDWNIFFFFNNFMTGISFVHIKMSYYFLIGKNYCKKQKIDIIIVVARKKLPNITLFIKKFQKEMQK